MAEKKTTMYHSNQDGDKIHKYITPVSLVIFTDNENHALGMRDGINHTIRMLSEYYDVVMRMPPYVEKNEDNGWKVRTRFAIAPTTEHIYMKPRWIDIQTSYYNEEIDKND